MKHKLGVMGLKTGWNGFEHVIMLLYEQAPNGLSAPAVKLTNYSVLQEEI